jgi:RecJ-like exonuclease
MSRNAQLKLTLSILAIALLLTVSVSATCAAAAKTYGKAIDPKKGSTVEVAPLFAETAKFEGKNVVVEGKIAQVCQTSGCWLTLTDGANQLFVQFFDFTVRLAPGTRVRIQGELRVKNKAPYLVGEGLEVR